MCVWNVHAYVLACGNDFVKYFLDVFEGFDLDQSAAEFGGVAKAFDVSGEVFAHFEEAFAVFGFDCEAGVIEDLRDFFFEILRWGVIAGNLQLAVCREGCLDFCHYPWVSESCSADHDSVEVFDSIAGDFG